MTLTVITPPAAPALSRDEVKAHLRVGHDGEDGYIDSLILAATSQLELASDLALVERRVMRTLTDWSPRLSGRGLMLLPRPATSLVSVTIGLPGPGDSEDLTDRFSLVGGRLCSRPWSMVPPIQAGEAAEITFDAGFGGTGDVPADLKLAIMHLVAEAYRTDGDIPIKPLPERVSQLVASHRQVRL
ncbi:MAG: hypothetical protein AAF216_07605 [Pseudomonadota bacterium]